MSYLPILYCRLSSIRSLPWPKLTKQWDRRADAAIPGFEAVYSRYFALKINVPIPARDPNPVSGECQALCAHRQGAHRRAIECRESIRQRWGDHRRPRLADAGGFLGGRDDVHLDLRHLVHAHHRVVVEVRLLDHTVLEGNGARQRRREAIADARLHLHSDDVRVYCDAAIDRADHALDVHPVLAARELDDLRHERIKRLMDGDPPRPVFRQRLAPARLLGGQFQYPQVARMLVQQITPQRERIL